MRNIQVLIAYDGSDFHGWQRQKRPGQAELRTVQGELESTLQRILRHPVNVIGSGRTDAGVHAEGQVANFLTASVIPEDKIQRALGSRLPADIVVLQARRVPLGFDARRSAVSKTYRYRIAPGPPVPCDPRRRRYVYRYQRGPLRIDRMAGGARHLVGTLDFKAMTSSKAGEKPSFVRTVMRCDITPRGDEIWVDVQGSGFLYNQVRNMVGTLIEVGRGHWEPQYVAEIIAGRDRTAAGPTAPPEGLCLVCVEYPPDDCIPDVLDPALSAAPQPPA